MTDFNNSNIDLGKTDAARHFGHLVNQTGEDIAEKTASLTSREKEIERRAQVCAWILLQEYRELVKENPLDSYHNVWKSDIFKESVKESFNGANYNTKIKLLDRVRDIIFENERLYSERPSMEYFESDSHRARLNISETQFR